MPSAEKPTIVIVAALPPPVHGQSAVNAAVAKHLQSLPAHLTVVDTSPPETQKGTTYHLTRLLRVLRALRQLVTERDAKTKTVYMPFEAGNGIIYNFFVALVSRLTGFRIVLHHHSSAHTVSYRHSFRLLAAVCGRRAVHVALSEQMASDLELRYGLSGQTVVSSNACHVYRGDPSRQERRGDRGIIVGLLANLNAEKGLDIAIDTVVAAREAGQEVRLVLAGPAASPEAANTIERATAILGDALEVWGPVKGAVKDRFYAYIDVFLFPTTYRYEAQPLVVYEALSHAVPVISTNAGYIEEMLANTGTVIPIGPDMVGRLGAALSQIAKNPQVLAELSLNARREFEGAADCSRTSFGSLCEILVATD